MNDGFSEDIDHGLCAVPKALPCKYLYDDHGVALFDAICQLEAYYPTRTELEILCKNRKAIADVIGHHDQIVELGAGNGEKVRLLLASSEGFARYIPVDISPAYLATCVAAVRRHFPRLHVLPVCADYTAPFALPALPARSTLVFFPGSTLGNFEPPHAVAFLRRIACLVGPAGGLLIGVDLKKDRAILERAYNDREGVTAAFNKNLLARINRELSGNFNLDRFDHHAFYNEPHGRIEMRLISGDAQSVSVGGRAYPLGKGEAITTEHSYKYAVNEFAALAHGAGFVQQAVWVDEGNLFSLQYLASSHRR